MKTKSVLVMPEYLHFRVFRSRKLQPKGGVTIFYSPAPTKAYIGLAVCSQLDNFSKRRGRDIARGRILTRSGLLTRDELVKASAKVATEAWKEICRRHGRPTGSLKLFSHKRK